VVVELTNPEIGEELCAAAGAVLQRAETGTIAFALSPRPIPAIGLARGCRKIGLSAGFKTLPVWLLNSLGLIVVSCC
jgi:hypothetical protein